MPTHRKRIGFLPRSEVQLLIDQICKDNKLSQSKVTGILVEEALNSRGVLNTSKGTLRLNSEGLMDNSVFINNDSEIESLECNLRLNDSSNKEEVQMINDFIEFKFFKNIMNQKKYYKK